MLSDLTTAAVGGPAGNYIEARTEAEIIEAVRSADAAGEPLLIIGGGSNLLISDDGFPGTVLKIASEGFTVSAEDSCGGVSVVVQAGHNWDALVEHAVLHAWSGIEALSGIPGATGATPVQNVGAYGVRRLPDHRRGPHLGPGTQRREDLHQLGAEVRLPGFDPQADHGQRLPALRCADRRVPAAAGPHERPIRYAELARVLGVEQGQRAYSNDVRREVLRLRASKGMVLDPADRDTYSTGSFFTNPIVPDDVADGLPENAPRYPGGSDGAGQAVRGVADRPRPGSARASGWRPAASPAAGPRCPPSTLWPSPTAARPAPPTWWRSRARCVPASSGVLALNSTPNRC